MFSSPTSQHEHTGNEEWGTVGKGREHFIFCGAVIGEDADAYCAENGNDAADQFPTPAAYEANHGEHEQAK